MLINKINEHIDVFENLKNVTSHIEDAAQAVKQACTKGQTIFICGNGGSAADAQHFSAELTGRYISNRKSYPAIALTTDTSAITAIANDYGYDYVFSRQLEGLGKANDILIAISTSGNSENIDNTITIAKQKNIKTIALLGRDGGKIANKADITIIVPSNITANIQEAHIFILHYFCEQLEE